MAELSRSDLGVGPLVSSEYTSMARRSNRLATMSLENAATAVEGTRLYTEGDDLYLAMLSSIHSARYSVGMESYIFSNDEIGWQFTQALTERAAAGLNVRLHLDAAGALGGSSQVMERNLHEQGVLLRWSHRWSWRQPLRYNRHIHRNLLTESLPITSANWERRRWPGRILEALGWIMRRWL